MQRLNDQSSNVTIEPAKNQQDSGCDPISTRAPESLPAVSENQFQYVIVEGETLPAAYKHEYRVRLFGLKCNEWNDLKALTKFVLAQAHNRKYLDQAVKYAASKCRAFRGEEKAPDLKGIEDYFCKQFAIYGPDYVNRVRETFALELRKSTVEVLAADSNEVDPESGEIRHDFYANLSNGKKLEDLAVRNFLENNFLMCFIDERPAVWTGLDYDFSDNAVPKALKRIYRALGMLVSKVELDNFISKIVGDSEINSVSRSSPYIIPCKNGYLCIDEKDPRLETCSMIPPTPKIVLTNSLVVNWSLKAYSKEMDEALDAYCMGDKRNRKALMMIAGSLLFRDPNLKKAVIFYGEKDGGKSTFLGLLRDVFGRTNTSTLTPNDLKGTYKLSELIGKSLNIADDISPAAFENVVAEIVKKIVSGNDLETEKKYKDPLSIAITTKLVIACNKLPAMHDAALLNRFIGFSFLNCFAADPKIAKALKKPQALEYLLKCMVEGLCELLQHYGKGKDPFISCTDAPAVQHCMEDMKEKSQPVYCFLKNTYGDDFEPLLYKYKPGAKKPEGEKLVALSMTGLYQAFQEYCKERDEDRACKYSDFKDDVAHLMQRHAVCVLKYMDYTLEGKNKKGDFLLSAYDAKKYLDDHPKAIMIGFPQAWAAAERATKQLLGQHPKTTE